MAVWGPRPLPGVSAFPLPFPCLRFCLWPQARQPLDSNCHDLTDKPWETMGIISVPLTSSLSAYNYDFLVAPSSSTTSVIGMCVPVQTQHNYQKQDQLYHMVLRLPLALAAVSGAVFNILHQVAPSVFQLAIMFPNNVMSNTAFPMYGVRHIVYYCPQPCG